MIIVLQRFCIDPEEICSIRNDLNQWGFQKESAVFCVRWSMLQCRVLLDHTIRELRGRGDSAYSLRANLWPRGAFGTEEYVLVNSRGGSRSTCLCSRTPVRSRTSPSQPTISSIVSAQSGQRKRNRWSIRGCYQVRRGWRCAPFSWRSASSSSPPSPALSGEWQFPCVVWFFLVLLWKRIAKF